MNSATPADRRAADIRRLGSTHFDLLIIGGGINGAGIARDAAMRGLKVALVEQDDWACGTSSRSSRLIHGGLRYLEHGWLRLVFEASRERRILLRTAPHLVRPLPFIWPVFRDARVPLWKLRAGLGLYDALSLFRNVARHRKLSARKLAAEEPALAEEKLTGGARYYDAATDDARLTLANVIAAAECGAVALNHASVVGITREPGGAHANGATVRDEISGMETVAHARIIINAAGPWSDEVRSLDELADVPAVRGTKGVHVAVPRSRVGNRNALTLLSPIDGRVMFVLPAGTHTIIGTTDTFTSAHPSQVRADEGDVRYLIDSANAFFPGAKLVRDDVVAAWAGIRPLVAAGTDDKASSASREHALERSRTGILSITGGKLTTYRSMSAEVVDEVMAELGRDADVTTGRVPLPGGDIVSLERESAAATTETGDEAIGAHVARAYGSRWRDMWAVTRRAPELASRLVPSLPYTMADCVWSVEREMAVSLADILIRRIPLAFEMRDQGRSVAPVVARAVAGRLGWNDAQVETEIANYERDLRRVFAIDPVSS